jgi:hypothetical protein
MHVDAELRSSHGPTDQELPGAPYSAAAGTAPGAARRPDRRPRDVHGAVASGVAWLTFMAALWMIVAPVVGGYGAIDRGPTRWADVGTATVVAVVALLQMFAPLRFHALGGLSVLLGVWVVLTPAVLGDGGSAAVTTNHVITGGVIVVTGACFGAVAARGRRRVERIHPGTQDPDAAAVAPRRRPQRR